MTLPATQGTERNNYIIDAVQRGAMDFKWAHITLTTADGHTGTFAVFERPGKIDGLYVGVGAGILQDIADILGCSFLTPKLQDEMYRQAPTKILPWLDFNMTQMQSTEWFRRSTVGIDTMLAAKSYAGGLAMGVGKPWQLSNLLVAHPGKAINYGLYVPASMVSGGEYYKVKAMQTVTLLRDARVLQDPGWAHPLDQDDYSELISLVSRQCVVDGQNMDFADLVRHPTLSKLVSHEGPLKVVRQPGVPIKYCPAPGPVSSAPIAGDGSDGKSVCPIRLTGLPGGSDVPPTPTPEPPAAPSQSVALPVLLAGGAAFATVGAAWWWLRKRNRR